MKREDFKLGAEVFLVSSVGGIFCRRVVELGSEAIAVVGPDGFRRAVFSDASGLFPTYGEYHASITEAMAAVRGADGSPWHHDDPGSPGVTTCIVPTPEVEQTQERMAALGWVPRKVTTIDVTIPGSHRLEKQSVGLFQGKSRSVLVFQRKELEDGS